MQVSKPIWLTTGGVATDDRGSLSYVNAQLLDIKRFYIVENNGTEIVRAWHGHKKEAKYVTAVAGSALIALFAVDDWESPSIQPSKITRCVLSDKTPEMLYIPPGFVNGFRMLTPGAKLMFFSTSSVHESKDDDFRFPASAFGDVWKIENR